MTPMQINIFRRRELQILAEGLSIEICVELGDIEQGHQHLRVMEALIKERNAAIQQLEEQGDDYFAITGLVSRLQAESRSAIRAQ